MKLKSKQDRTNLIYIKKKHSKFKKKRSQLLVSFHFCSQAYFLSFLLDEKLQTIQKPLTHSD